MQDDHNISCCHFFVFQWGGNKSLLAVNTGETVIILNEQVMNAHYNLEVSDSLSSTIVSISYAHGNCVYCVLCKYQFESQSKSTPNSST